jgi:hypothetical protein
MERVFGEQSMTDEIQGVVATTVLSSGSADEHGFVELSFAHGASGAIAFTKDVSLEIVAAFMNAASHVQRDQALLPGQIDVRATGYKISDAELTFQPAPDTTKEARLLLTLVTPTGASLNFGLSERTSRKLARLLEKGVDAFREPPRAN